QAAMVEASKHNATVAEARPSRTIACPSRCVIPSPLHRESRARVHCRLLAAHRTKAHGLWQRLPRMAGFCEALHDLLSIPGSGGPEWDPTVEINPFERSGRRIALCPSRIGEILLWCVRDGARAKEEGGHENRASTLQQPATLLGRWTEGPHEHLDWGLAGV